MKKKFMPVLKKNKKVQGESLLHKKAIFKISKPERVTVVKEVKYFPEYLGKITTEMAVAHLAKVLKKDKGYRLSWAANIAMAFRDNEKWYIAKTGKKSLSGKDRAIIADMAAEYFLKQLCGQLKNPAGR